MKNALKEIARLKRRNERYREALNYARYQSYRGNQVRGVEDETYFAWIHEATSKALGVPRLGRRD